MKNITQSTTDSPVGQYAEGILNHSFCPGKPVVVDPFLV